MKKDTKILPKSGRIVALQIGDDKKTLNPPVEVKAGDVIKVNGETLAVTAEPPRVSITFSKP